MHDIRQLEEEQHQRNEQTRYKLRARVLAAIMIPTWFPDYDSAIHDLDHKFSLKSGYQHHVPLDIISSRNNLQLLSPKDNRRKGEKCSISIEELLHGYRCNPFVTRGCGDAQEDADLEAEGSLGSHQQEVAGIS